MTRIITCASFAGSGSSAITDLISEYSNVFSLGRDTDCEFTFLHDPDGISDLEYNLVENKNRFNSGFALKRYKRLVEFYAGSKLTKKWSPYFYGKWKQISYEYIDDLIDFQHDGYSVFDLLMNGIPYYYIKTIEKKVLKKILLSKNVKRNPILRKEKRLYAFPNKEKFIKCTRDYIEKLIETANKEKKHFVMIDQFFPVSNVKRYMEYVEDVKVVIIDRDPRDLYILSKYYWSDGTSIIPCECVSDFCKWYKMTREISDRKLNHKDVILLYFEDLIYKYDETIARLENFIGLQEKDHIYKFKKLDPLISVHNTRLFDKNDFGEEINYIENELYEYLYDYKNVDLTQIKKNDDFKVF